MTQFDYLIEGPEAHSDEWYAIRQFSPERKRKIVFGASSAADICGVGYRTPLHVYLQARGELEAPDHDDEVKERLEIGNALEPSIVKLYKRRVSCQMTRKHPMYLHRDLPWMGATPDALCSKSRGRDKGTDIWGLEIKNTNVRMIDATGENPDRFGAEGDQVPRYVLMQAQQQCEVLGVPRVDVPVLVGGGSLRIFTIHRQPELIKHLIRCGNELYERICNGDPPEPSFGHAATLGLLKQIYGIEAGKTVRVGANWLHTWEEVENLTDEINQAHKRLDSLKSEILHQMGEAEFLQFEDSDVELKRTWIPPSIMTPQKAAEYVLRVGQTTRDGYARLTKRARNDR